MAKTMEQYMSKTRADYGSEFAWLKIDAKNSFELKGQFLKELRDNTFSGSDHEDANEHIEKVLEIEVILFSNGLDVQTRQILDSKGAIATRSTKNSDGLVTIQAQLNNLGREIKKVNEKVYAAQVGCEQCKIPHYTKDCPLNEEGQFVKELRDNTFSGSDHEDVNEHIEKVLEIVDLFHIPNITQDQVMLRAFPILDVQTRQILDSKGAIPSKTATDAKVAIQEMDEYYQKWHNGTSRTRSTETSNGYTQFGRPYQGGKYRATALGFYQSNNANPSSTPQKEKDPGSFTLPCYINNVCFDNALADLGASDVKVTLILERPFLSTAYGDYIELNDINVPLELRRNQVDDLMPTIKEGEAMKMEHYLSHTDYPIWQVIQNGNDLVSVTTDTNGVIKVLPLKIAEEVVAREKKRKSRTTLLMALPKDHLAKFHKMADGLHKRYDRFQTLLSQLEIHGAGVSHEDENQKFLRSLPSSWSQVALIMRTKPGLDTLSFDDLYNNLKVFEHDVKGTTASSSNTQNEGSSSYTNEVNHSFFANQSSAPQLDYDDLEQINDDDMEEMNLIWQVAMISMRIKKFYKRTCRKLQLDTKDPVGFDKTKVECFNCYKMRYFARDYRAKGNQDSRRRDIGYNGN
nr:hypothetical protein [Tanacetum cinerariifolium]